jgi:hypothetical protein
MAYWAQHSPIQPTKETGTGLRKFPGLQLFFQRMEQPIQLEYNRNIANWSAPSVENAAIKDQARPCHTTAAWPVTISVVKVVSKPLHERDEPARLL